MIANTLKVTCRHMLGHRLFTLINIGGLAFGLACCLLIIQFVRHELAYDDFWRHADTIYRLSPNYSAEALGGERRTAANVAALAPLIEKTGLDGVEAVARIGGMHGLVSRGDQANYEDNIRWADNAIFDIFDVTWLRGQPSSALAAPHSVVLTQRLARKYFGDADPIGDTLLLENTLRVTVTGVIADLPANSHLSADMIASMDTGWDILDFDYSNNWSFTFFHTYIRVTSGTDAQALAAGLPALIDANVNPDIQEAFRLGGGNLTFTAYNVRDIHLRSQRPQEMKEAGSIAFVVVIATIGLTILLVACINFMNLSTARASRRAREVGMRKAVGASHSQLVVQFLWESLLLSMVAVLAALVLVEILLPVFNALVNRDLDFRLLADPLLLVIVAAVTLFTAILAGSYPAFYLAGFNPVGALKQAAPGTEKGLALRNLLVVVQFTVAIALIVVTLTVTQQMRYVRDRDLGFNKDQVMVLWGTHEQGLGAGWEALKQALLQRSDVTHVTEDVMYPGRAGSRLMRLEGGDPAGFNIAAKRIGFGFFATYDIALVAGRDFNRAIPTDTFMVPAGITDGSKPTAAYVVNEAAARYLGYAPGDILGKTLDMDFSNDFSTSVSGPIIGVVEDVNLQSLHREIEPLVYYTPGMTWAGSPTFVDASVRINTADVAQTLAGIRALWETHVPEIPFIYNFLDTDYEALYQDERQQGRLVSWSATLAIVIACLGLFGLAAFSAERRTKEIGIRKVMGGSVWSIVLLLTNDFSKLVLIANVIAWPVAWFAMNRWLENFAYRIDLTPMIFIGSGLIALCIAWVTVGGTAATAASRKPVLALRYE